MKSKIKKKTDDERCF